MLGWFRKEVMPGNELWQVLLFLGVIFCAMVAGRLARLVIARFGRRFPLDEDRWVRVLLKSSERTLLLICLTVGMWLGFAYLTVSPSVREVLNTILRVMGTVAIGYLIYCLVDVVDHWLSKWTAGTVSRIDNMLAPLVGKSLRITILVVISLQVMDAISDRPITSVLAGLGVGGLAIALAGQETIKNFFGSIVIVADKPFEIGDRVKFEGFDGPVESVGFRSTRVRTLDGSLVTIPNSEMVSETIENVGKRLFIRHKAHITITYDTPPHKVEEAVQILKDILKDHEGCRPEYPPRVHFSAFNDASLNLQMIYWYHPGDYWLYLEFAHRVNLEILRRFNAAGIDFAFPTQTLYLAGDPKRPLLPKPG